MKILHVSDTHLGYSAYRKTTEDGINLREIDIYNAFEQFIEYSIKSKADLILHAGDLFDSVRPNNRALKCAIKQIDLLSKEHIPFIVIAGNHEHPKLKETGHIFSIFDHMENVYPIYNAKYEKLSFEIKKEKVLIHALPQCELKTKFNEELKKIKPSSDFDYNILLTHGAVSGIKVFSMNEFNELIIPSEVIKNNFDYIALGHFHKYTKLSKNVFYSGSTERLSFSEAADKKGFIEIELSEGSFKQKFIEIKNRPMTDSIAIKCSNLKLNEVMRKIKETIKDIKPKEKIFRITLDGIPNNIFRSLDFEEIKKVSNNAVHFEIKANVSDLEKIKSTSSSKLDALTNEFKQFLDTQDIEEKETILDLGIGYIEKIQARDEGK